MTTPLPLWRAWRSPAEPRRRIAEPSPPGGPWRSSAADLIAWSALSPDGRVAAVAAGQHGAAHAGQLQACGLSETGIRRRVGRGVLHRVHPAVYAVGHPGLSPDGRIMAALLAGGDGAAVSHLTAAGLLRVLPEAAGPVHVCVPGAAGRTVAGIVAHRSAVAPQDVVVVRNIPATGIHRCLLDLGDLGSRRLVADAFHEAQVLRILRVSALRELLDRSPGRRGAGILLGLLAAGEAPVVSRSELERRFLALCAAAGLPAPRCEVVVGRHRVDFLWPEAGVVVEVDGIRFHENDRARRRDRTKDRLLALRDLLVLRYDWTDVTTRQPLVAAELGAALDRRTGATARGVAMERREVAVDRHAQA